MSDETVVKNEVTEETTPTVEPESEQVNQEAETLKARVNELSEDNRRQRALVEQLMTVSMNRNSGVPVQQPEDDSGIDPEITKRLAKTQAGIMQQVQGMYGGLLEEMDRTAMLTSPLAEVYKEHEQEVENLRKQVLSESGRYFKREEALANLMLKKGLLSKNTKKTIPVVRQIDVQPGGVTNKASEPTNLTPAKPKTLKEKLAGQKF